MEDLIKALQILLKYGNPKYPTVCEHDILYIVGIDLKKISIEDINELENLGFNINIEESEIYSFKFGSA
jgi:hypothetical protein